MQSGIVTIFLSATMALLRPPHFPTGLLLWEPPVLSASTPPLTATLQFPVLYCSKSKASSIFKNPLKAPIYALAQTHLCI